MRPDNHSVPVIGQGIFHLFQIERVIGIGRPDVVVNQDRDIVFGRQIIDFQIGRMVSPRRFAVGQRCQVIMPAHDFPDAVNPVAVRLQETAEMVG